MEASVSIDFIHRFEKLKDWRNPDMITYRLCDLLMMAFLVILTEGKNSNSNNDDLILSAIENRWDIENGFHKEKDTFFNEDSFRSTDKNSSLTLAVLDNLAIQLVKIYQMISGEELHIAKKYVRCNPLEAINQIQAVMDNDELIKKIHAEMIKIKKLGLA